MKLTPRQIAAMAALIALNVAIGGLVHILQLPIFLDAIGTIVAALVLGAVPGMIVGAASFLVAAALVDPVYVYFVGTQAAIALYAHVVATKLSGFRTTPRAVATGLGLGVVAAIVSAPVIVLVFGGVAGSGRDLITATLMASGSRVVTAVFASGAASEPIDKTLQVLAAYAILKSLPKRVLEPFKNDALTRNGLL